MAHRTVLKTSFEATRTIQPFYTGGSVAITQDGSLFCGQLGEDVVLTDLTSNAELGRVSGDGEPVTSISISPLGSHLVVCSRSLSMRIYELRPLSPSYVDVRLLRTLRPHASPVVVCAVDATGTLLATGGADGVVKVWDIRGGYVTHTFHGHSGVISALRFFQVEVSAAAEVTPRKRRKSRDNEEDEVVDYKNGDATVGFRLASGGEDGNVRIWNLHKRTSAGVLTSHGSVVRSIEYSPEENALVSASRDKTAVVWDARTWKIRRIISALESLESAGFLRQGQLIFTGGETGCVRVWSITGDEITAEQEAKTETEAILYTFQFPRLGYLMTIQADQTITYHSLAALGQIREGSELSPLRVVRQISGTHDEVIDLAYVGKERSLLALATNVEDVRLIAISKPIDGSREASFGADITSLKGHEDVVICMDVDWSGHWLATGAKDNTARLWKIDTDSGSFECHATFTGHAGSIGGITLPHTVPPSDSAAFRDPLGHQPAFLITGSQDNTVKKWEIPSRSSQKTSGKALYTRKAHDKDINALDTNDRGILFASASQDRTVKIWNVQEGEVQGVLRGHKRGVWAIRFAPSGISGLISGSGQVSSSQGLVLTGSADKTVRVWTLADYSCLLMLEGHTNSVLKVLWLPSGQRKASQEAKPAQVASAAGDGLVKIWNLATGEVECTLDNHTDRVWALAVQPNMEKTSAAVEAAHTDTEMGDDSASEAEEEEDASSQPSTVLVSGGGDGVLTFWTDTTRAVTLESRKQESQRVEQDQQLSNLIYAKDYRSAIVLALQLDQPGRLLSLFTSVAAGGGDDARDDGSVTGRKEVDDVVASLSDSQLYKLLLRVRDWNTNARTADVAQRILHTIVTRYPAEELASLKTVAADSGEAKRSSASSGRSVGAAELYGAIRAYTDRHLRRVDELLEQSYLLDFTLSEMDEVAGRDLLNGSGPALNGHAAILNGDAMAVDG